MATYSKIVLSGSTNGKQIKVAATSSPGTILHTAVTGTSNLDEIWLWASNTDAATVKLSIEFGGTTAASDVTAVGLPSDGGLILVTPGLVLQNSLVVRAFADTADVVCVSGFVNRITA